jgi:hypothetical protein
MLSCIFPQRSSSCFASYAMVLSMNKVCWDGLALTFRVVVITPRIPLTTSGFTGVHGSTNDFVSREFN